MSLLSNLAYMSIKPRRLTYLFDLLRELIVRDLKLRYKRSLLGIAWSLVNPLAQMLVLRFVFSRVLPLNIPNYASFLFTGLLAWNWFQTSLYAATGSIVDNRELIRKPGFSAMILPIVTVATNFIHFLLALPILLIFLWINDISLNATCIVLPVIFAVQFLFTLSLSYLVATLHVTFRDTQYLLGIVLLLGFYLSPVFYDTGAIPMRFQMIYRLNPMVVLIDAYRQILLQGQLPGGLALLALSLISAGLLWVSYRIFIRASAQFAEEL
jgi:lipopolysaccharide transport system permease protein